MSGASLGSGPVVTVDRLVKDFRPGFGLVKKRVLDGISFHVARGEIFGFVGPNGAGKTTTLKVLMGLIRASEGGATILGHDVAETEFRRHVGFLPENPYFYDHLTGREILDFYARLGGVPVAERADRVATLLDWVKLAHARDARLRTYSKGMLQRVGIAQALVHDPEVVFLDEPMSGLDPLGRKEIRDLILRLRDEGKTVFMNTHILSDVEMVCDRVAIIVSGKIRYEGRIEDFLAEGERCSDLVLSGLSPEPAQRIEDEFGATLQGLGGHIEARLAQKHVNTVIKMALDWGAEVVSVTPHRASLEDIFLTAVEEGEREGHSTAATPRGGLAVISPARVGAIGANTVREAIRNKLLYTLVFFAVLLIGTGFLLATLSYVERERIMQDVGLAAIRLFGVGIAIFLGVGLIHKEVDRRTIYTIVTKPVSRAEFLLGKFVGLVATVWLQLAIMSAAFVLVSLVSGAPVNGGHAAALLLVGMELMVIVGVATLFSSFTTPLLASLFTVGIYAVGHLTRDLVAIARSARAEGVEKIASLVYYLLPDLEMFNRTIEAVHGLAIHPGQVGWPVLYGVGYTACLLFLAAYLFERRDFR